jgi:hypothetical protein
MAIPVDFALRPSPPVELTEELPPIEIPVEEVSRSGEGAGWFCASQPTPIVYVSERPWPPWTNRQPPVRVTVVGSD